MGKESALAIEKPATLYKTLLDFGSYLISKKVNKVIINIYPYLYS